MRNLSALDLVDAEGLRKLRANAGDNYTLVSFWATWCGSCVAEFSEFRTLSNVQRPRLQCGDSFGNNPDEKAFV